ncbi:MAG TPA: hypothetical protein VFA55_04445 [Candidatus Kapabacteria bacterium]|nr:hypothetical protein [Candidatus Kapabacteria bacterium]
MLLLLFDSFSQTSGSSIDWLTPIATLVAAFGGAWLGSYLSLQHRKNLEKQEQENAHEHIKHELTYNFNLIDVQMKTIEFMKEQLSKSTIPSFSSERFLMQGYNVFLLKAYPVLSYEQKEMLYDIYGPLKEIDAMLKNVNPNLTNVLNSAITSVQVEIKLLELQLDADLSSKEKRLKSYEAAINKYEDYRKLVLDSQRDYLDKNIISTLNRIKKVIEEYLKKYPFHRPLII